MKLAELAGLTGARYEPESAAEIEIDGAAGLDEAEPGHVTFLANPRYTPRVQTTRAAAVYLAEGVEAGRDIAVLRARDPYLAYTRALRLFHPPRARAPFVHPSAVIDESARVHESAYVGACVVVGRDSEIGAGAQVHPNVTIYDGVRIGENSIIHSGVALREGTQIG
ncbi:MAG: UDP-3-O-(3-hydroxymyristoyl)glucosamine N-acyltransferase, partial [Acidobacteria bacterium]|nr:UDP-3-O-(3-hydroxymyristoyl)glucosamine N-acyltransferase [Acidobacteriota bacterium]